MRFVVCLYALFLLADTVKGQALSSPVHCSKDSQGNQVCIVWRTL